MCCYACISEYNYAGGAAAAGAQAGLVFGDNGVS